MHYLNYLLNFKTVMKTIQTALFSLVSSLFNLILNTTVLYLSILFFLVLIIDEMSTGGISKERKENMEAFLLKVKNAPQYLRSKLNSKDYHVNKSLS